MTNYETVSGGWKWRALHRLLLRTNIESSGKRCWLREGSFSDGYSHLRVDNVYWAAHRLSFTIFYEPIDDPLMCVCHRCDVRNCVNPAHLFLGTKAENNLDRDRKGRTVSHKGSAQGRSKLVEDQVLDIRDQLNNGSRVAELARLYEVSTTTIYHIGQRKIWKHI